MIVSMLVSCQQKFTVTMEMALGNVPSDVQQPGTAYQTTYPSVSVWLWEMDQSGSPCLAADKDNNSLLTGDGD